MLHLRRAQEVHSVLVDGCLKRGCRRALVAVNLTVAEAGAHNLGHSRREEIYLVKFATDTAGEEGGDGLRSAACPTVERGRSGERGPRMPGHVRGSRPRLIDSSVRIFGQLLVKRTRSCAKNP